MSIRGGENDENKNFIHSRLSSLLINTTIPSSNKIVASQPIQNRYLIKLYHDVSVYEVTSVFLLTYGLLYSGVCSANAVAILKDCTSGMTKVLLKRREDRIEKEQQKVAV